MSDIKIISLGGVRENAKNMYAVEVDDEIFILDCGLKYPENELLGIDFVVPDFSYLREKNLIHHISRLEQTRIALELNLVNHIFPSGGVSGISYTTWRMHKLGVSSARSTFAQVIRYVTGFLSLLV